MIKRLLFQDITVIAKEKFAYGSLETVKMPTTLLLITVNHFEGMCCQRRNISYQRKKKNLDFGVDLSKHL